MWSEKDHVLQSVCCAHYSAAHFTASLASLFRVLRSSQTSAMECLNVLLLIHKNCISTHCQQQAQIQIPSQDGKCEQRTTNHLVWTVAHYCPWSYKDVVRINLYYYSWLIRIKVRTRKKKWVEIKTGRNCLTSDKKSHFMRLTNFCMNLRVSPQWYVKPKNIYSPEMSINARSQNSSTV